MVLFWGKLFHKRWSTAVASEAYASLMLAASNCCMEGDILSGLGA